VADDAKVVEEPGSNGHVTGFVTIAADFRITEPIRLFSDPPPESASARAYFRDGVPAIYREQDFPMRFLGALEGVLDPIVAILDSLPAYFDAELAPQDLLELLTAWLGVELDETQTEEQWRRVVRSALELGRRRGTCGGMELALELAFPDLSFRVEDGGGVISAPSPDELPDAGEGGFVVYCDTPVPEERMPTIARVIEASRPAHVPYRLRVKKPRAPKKPKPAQEEPAKATKATKATKDAKATKSTRTPPQSKPKDEPDAGPNEGGAEDEA
jgi:phage tail-like protein